MDSGIQFYRRGARWISGVVGLIGLVCLVSLYFGYSRVYQISPTFPAITPNTALVLVLLSLAIFLRTINRIWAKRSAQAVALLIIVLGVGTLGEYLFGWNTAFEDVLFGHRAILGLLPSRRPAPEAAICFIVDGLAIVLMDLRTSRGTWPTQYLLLVGAAVGLLALSGYLTGADALYSSLSPTPQVGMSLNAAVGTALASLGILFSGPSYGVMTLLTSDTLGGLMARRLFVVIFLTPPLVGIVLMLGRRTLYNQTSEHALSVIFTMLIFLALTWVTAKRLDRSDRKRMQAEASLQRSREQFALLIENASDGILISDLSGKMTDVNRSACDLLGYRPEEIIGKTVEDLIPTQDVPRLKASREQMLFSGAPMLSEWNLKKKTGDLVPVEVSARILPDGRWQSFIRDIRERKRVQDELFQANQAEQRLRAQIEAVGQASQEVSEAVARLPFSDLRAVLTTVLVQAQAITGARYAAIGIGEDVEKPFDPWVFIGMSEEQAAKIGRAPRPVGVLGSVARASHSVRIADVHHHPAFASFPKMHPDMRSFLGIPIRHMGKSIGNLFLAEKRGAQEFTAEDQRNIELLASRVGIAIATAHLYQFETQQRQWLQSVIDQMPEGVIILDREGKIVTSNRSSQAISAPDLLREIPVKQAIQEDKTLTGFDLIYRDSEGREIPLLASVAPVRNRDGQISGAVALFQDITLIKEAQRLREEWSSVIAHDLKQPLSVIAMNAEFLASLRAGSIDEREAQALSRIRVATGGLSRMINDLTDISTLEAKRLKLNPKRFDLTLAVKELIERVEHLTQEFAVRVSEPGYPVYLEADPLRVEQVLTNLISNAAKYGTKGTEILVRIMDRETELEVSVSNHGKGIPADEIPNLFNRFARSREMRHSDVPGLGLGLYICKGLIEAHHGKIWVKSVPGKMTSFHFTLPRLASGREAA